MQDGTLQADILSLQSLKAELETLKKQSEYHIGDTYTIDYRGAGYATNNGSNVFTTLFLDKPIGDDVKSVSFNDFIVTLRQGNTYIAGSPSENVTLSQAGLAVQVYELSKCSLTILISYKQTFAVTNNDAVGVNLLNCKITFGG